MFEYNCLGMVYVAAMNVNKNGWLIFLCRTEIVYWAL